MKKFVFLSGLAAAAIVAAYAAGSSTLGNHVKTLQEAQGLSATFTYQVIGGSATTYKVDLAKPNLVRIDKPGELIVADGQTVTTFDKKANTYFKTPQTEADLGRILGDDEFLVFAPFFHANGMGKMAKVSDGGTKNRKGTAMQVVEAQFDARGMKQATFYVDPASHLVRQVEYLFNDGPQPVRMLMDTKQISVSAQADAGLFAFKAPEGAKELSLEEMLSDKWYHDLEEAKAVAAKTGRKIFVDFFATWCGPCKKLAAEVFPLAEFKALSKKLVFCKIDVDEQKSVAQAYKVTAMPTQMVLNADGSVVGTEIGYSNPAGFFEFINKHIN